MVDITKKELANLIRSFVDGSCGEWDWDDFTSVKQSDPEVEVIRGQINGFPDRFPPNHKNHWCNEAGRKALLDIAESLSASQKKDGTTK